MKAQLKHGLGRKYYEDGATPQNLEGWLSKSMLWQFRQSPHKWRRGKPFEATPAMQFGTLVHTLALQPENVDQEFAISPFDDFRKKEAKEWKAKAEQGGKAVIKQAEFDHAMRVAEAFTESTHLYSLGEHETEVAVYGEIAKFPVKCMIDVVPKNGTALADLKTCTSIGSTYEMTQQIINMGYHMQAALYRDLYAMATGREINKFKFVFVEKAAPYETALVTLQGVWLDRGRELYLDTLAMWSECRAVNAFPPAHPDEIILDPPDWM